MKAGVVRQSQMILFLEIASQMEMVFDRVLRPAEGLPDWYKEPILNRGWNRPSLAAFQRTTDTTPTEFFTFTGVALYVFDWYASCVGTLE